MIKVVVNINGKEYSLKGKDDEKYLREVAEFVDTKINEIKAKNPVLSSSDMGVLAAINIADDLYNTDKSATELVKKNKYLEERTTSLESSVERLRSEVDSLKKQREDIIKDNQAKIEVLKEQVNTLNTEKNRIYLEKDTLDKRVKDKEKEIINFNNDIVNKDKEFNEIKNLNDIINKELVKIKDENKELKEKLREKEYINDKISTELKEAVNNKEIIEKKVENNNLNEALLNQQIEDLQKECKSYQEELKATNNLFNDSKVELDKLQKENKQLNDSIKVIKKNVKEKFGEGNVQELKTAKYRIMELEKKLLDVQIALAKERKEKDPLLAKN